MYAGLKGEWSPEASYGKVNYLNWNHPHSSGWSSSKLDRGEIQRGRLDPGRQGVQHHQGCRPCRILGAGWLLEVKGEQSCFPPFLNLD